LKRSIFFIHWSIRFKCVKHLFETINSIPWYAWKSTWWGTVLSNPNKWAHKPKQMGTLKLSTILRELIETLQCFESKWLGYIVGKCKLCIPQLETQSFHPFRIQLWMWSGTTVFTDQHHDNYFRNENLTKWKYHWYLQNAFTQFPILHYKKSLNFGLTD
jgi:hypothetical protein